MQSDGALDHATLNIDLAVIKDSHFGDTSRMFIVGLGSVLVRRLVQITYERMWLEIGKICPGALVGHIGHVIQKHA